MFDLKGKTAVVTGGSIGLGAQMATALAEAGADIVIAARRVDRCQLLCKQLDDLGIRTLAAACDVSNDMNAKKDLAKYLAGIKEGE